LQISLDQYILQFQHHVSLKGSDISLKGSGISSNSDDIGLEGSDIGLEGSDIDLKDVELLRHLIAQLINSFNKSLAVSDCRYVW